MSDYIGEIDLPFRSYLITFGVSDDQLESDTMRRISDSVAELAAATLSCARRAGQDSSNPSATDDACEGAETLLALSIALRNAAKLLDENHCKVVSAAG